MVSCTLLCKAVSQSGVVIDRKLWFLSKSCILKQNSPNRDFLELHNLVCMSAMWTRTLFVFQLLPRDRATEDVAHLSAGDELASFVWDAGSPNDWGEIPAIKTTSGLMMWRKSSARAMHRTQITVFLCARYQLIPFTAVTEAVQTLEFVSRSHACFVDIPKARQSLILMQSIRNERQSVLRLVCSC